MQAESYFTELYNEDLEWLTIDPGVGGTGYAVWWGSDLVESGSITPKSKGSWSEKVLEISQGLRLNFNLADVMFYEQPQALKNACTAGGDLVKLSILAGIIHAKGMDLRHQPCGVEINKWKGNMKKELCTKRILSKMKKLGWKPTTNKDHETDAVGIGLYLLNKF